MTGQDALWSAQEVKTQAEQCPGQVTVWEAAQEAALEKNEPVLADGGTR